VMSEVKFMVQCAQPANQSSCQMQSTMQLTHLTKLGPPKQTHCNCSHATNHTTATVHHEATRKAVTPLLNCCTTHPNAAIHFIASDMILCVESHASCLSEPKAWPHAAGCCHSSSMPSDPSMPPDANSLAPPANNGPINVLHQIM